MSYLIVDINYMIYCYYFWRWLGAGSGFQTPVTLQKWNLDLLLGAYGSIID